MCTVNPEVELVDDVAASQDEQGAFAAETVADVQAVGFDAFAVEGNADAVDKVDEVVQHGQIAAVQTSGSSCRWLKC